MFYMYSEDKMTVFIYKTIGTRWLPMLYIRSSKEESGQLG